MNQTCHPALIAEVTKHPLRSSCLRREQVIDSAALPRSVDKGKSWPDPEQASYAFFLSYRTDVLS